MATKWRSKAGEAGVELARETVGVQGFPALTQAAEHAIRFLLGAVLSAGGIFGGCAPFGVGFVACSGPGAEGLCALLGACWGYLFFQGFSAGLRCAAACVLVFSVGFAFYDVGFCRKSWFMPLMAAAMDAVTGFVYLSDAAWEAERVVFFLSEVILAGGSAYFYRTAFSPWKGQEEGALTARQRVSVFFLLGTLLVSLAGVTFFDGLSLGRVTAVLLVMAVARVGGPQMGAAAGVTAGLGMDLAAGGMPFYAMAYGFAGLLMGAGRRQGRLFAVLSYVVANAAAVLWSWELQPRLSGLYEVFMAAVLFLLLPEGWLKRLSVFLVRQGEEESRRSAAAHVRARLDATAAAFRQLRDSLRAAFPKDGPNDGDPSSVFDRAAERVCRRCALRENCWEKDYISTFNALNDALPTMLERGKGEAGDFPGWFASRCVHFSEFLRAANEEVVALRYRRQYQARLRESRGAVCRQYETLADILTASALELSAELTPDLDREKRLRRHMAELGLEGEAAAYYDQAGHLRLEASGEGAQALGEEREVRRLSEVMGVPLRVEETGRNRAELVQAEPLMAMAALAARRREGQGESGDTGTWFKRGDGSLFVLLCDGMGSGQAAHRESGLAVRLLEEFLRSGMDSAAAMGTVNSALALKNEESGAFTTVDLLRIDLYTGRGELCKLGAAPTYLRRGETVSRLSGAALPAGLADGEADVTALDLGPGDWVLLVSDGVCDSEEDGWVRELLEGFNGASPKELARQVMEESERRVGPADDRTVVVIGVRKRGGQ